VHLFMCLQKLDSLWGDAEAIRSSVPLDEAHAGVGRGAVVFKEERPFV
jgi:hypothetical protein